jgi:hypothetical protein
MRDKFKQNDRKTAVVKHAKIAARVVNGTYAKLLDGIKRKECRVSIKIGDVGAIHAVKLLILPIKMLKA